MEERKIIAVFGGGFNPPLNSHTNLAKELLKNYKSIKKIIFMPVSTKYNKLGLIEDKHRYNMLKLVCNKNDKLEVSDIELKSVRQLYTIETLNLLKTIYKEYDIWFILGTDNLKEFKMWHNPEEFLKSFKLLVLERKNDSFEEIINKDEFLRKNRNSIIKAENINRFTLSSTFVRNQIGQDKDVSEFMQKEVLKYINEHNLYK